MPECRDCGIEYERIGGMRSCDECVASRARSSCLDCGTDVERSGKRGPLPRRCASCRSRHKSKQAYRYVRNRMEQDPKYAEHERAMRRERNRRTTQGARARDPERYRRQNREAKARAYADPEKRERMRERAKLGRIARHYGLTKIEYEMLLEQHGRACAICRATDDVLCVDHCHDSGKIRGLLCQGCNIGLGGFKDDPARLRGAIRYLSRYG